MEEEDGEEEEEGEEEDHGTTMVGILLITPSFPLSLSMLSFLGFGKKWKGIRSDSTFLFLILLDFPPLLNSNFNL